MRDTTALRVALLTHSVNPRGGVVHTLELASALCAAGLQITVMAPAAPSQRFFRAVPCAVELIDLPAHGPSTVDGVRARIAAYVRHLMSPRRGGRVVDHFDVMHAQDGIGGNALSILRERGLIGGFVRTVHHVERHADALIDAWEARAIRSASHVVCVSDVWRDVLGGDYQVAAEVIANGVNLQRFMPDGGAADEATVARLGLRRDAPLIVSVGGVEARKNTLRTLQAFIALRCRHTQAQFAVVGGASLLDHSRYRAEFAAQVAASGLKIGPGADIVVTGPIADADMPCVLRAANAVAFPSLTEGFGLVVLESLASGTPTVVSRRPPFTEYLREGEVHWADPLDVASIDAALEASLRQGRFAPPPVCARFSWSASAVRHRTLYRRFVADMALMRKAPAMREVQPCLP